MRKDKRKKEIKYQLRYLGIAAIVMLISVFLIIKSIDNSQNKSDIFYSYNTNKKMDYKVFLKDNSYMENEYLEMGKTYIPELVDYVELNLFYEYLPLKNVELNTKYSIVARVIVDYAGTTGNAGHLWEKEYVLSPEQSIEPISGKVVLDKNFNLDYNYYNDLVKGFEEKFDMSMCAYLEVDFITKTKADVNNIEVPTVTTVTAKMNLNEQVFSVDVNNSEIGEKSIVSEVANSFNIVLLVFAILMFMVSLIVFLTIISRMTNVNITSYYDIVLRKILKSYGDIVAEIVTPIDVDRMRIVDVKNFDQLLDIEEEIRMPILFYELIKGEEGHFTIVYDNIAYRYILKKRNKKKLY